MWLSTILLPPKSFSYPTWCLCSTPEEKQSHTLTDSCKDLLVSLLPPSWAISCSSTTLHSNKPKHVKLSHTSPCLLTSPYLCQEYLPLSCQPGELLFTPQDPVKDAHGRCLEKAEYKLAFAAQFHLNGEKNPQIQFWKLYIMNILKSAGNKVIYSLFAYCGFWYFDSQFVFLCNKKLL